MLPWSNVVQRVSLSGGSPLPLTLPQAVGADARLDRPLFGRGNTKGRHKAALREFNGSQAQRSSANTD
jgi:hypothetical protein